MEGFAKKFKSFASLVTTATGIITAVKAVWPSEGIEGIDWRLLAAAGALLVIAIVLAWESIARRLWPHSELLDKGAVYLPRTEFVGRQDELEILRQQINSSRLVFLVGESGSGKSSLLASGLLPALAASKTRLPLLFDNWQNDWIDGPRETLAEVLHQNLDHDMRRALSVGTVVPSSDALAVLGRIHDALGRTPLLLFDQFDDYLGLNRSHFLAGPAGRLLTKEELLSANAFWREIAALHAAHKVRCLFASRDESSWALTAVQFEEPTTYHLPRLDRAVAEKLLRERTTGDKIVARPESGFNDLRQRLLDDLAHSEGRILPIEMRLAFRGLADLRYLTVADYNRAGGLQGLESLHLSAQIDTAARSAGVSPAQVRSLLRLMITVEPPHKTVPRTFDDFVPALSPQPPDRASILAALSSLASSDVIRPLLLRDSAEPAWQLDHDFLCDVVLTLEQRANRFPHLLAAAARSYDEAPSLIAKWRSLLGPGRQLALVMHRLRGRFTYGRYHRFALLSTLRFIPWSVVIAAALTAYYLVHMDTLTNWSRELAGAVGSAKRLDDALLLAVAAVEASPTVEAQDALLAALQRAPQVRTMLHGRRGKSMALAFAPQSRILASADETGAIQLWDTATWQMTGHPIETGSKVTTLTFFGDTLLSGDTSGSLRFWDPRQGVQRGLLLADGRNAVATVSLHPSGNYALVGYSSGRALLWDLAQRPARAVPLPLNLKVKFGAFDPAGQRVAMVDHAGSLVVYQFAAGVLSSPWKPPVEPGVTALAWNRNSGLVLGREDGTIVWLANGARTVERKRERAHEDQVLRLVFNDDGTRLASKSLDGDVRIWDLESEEPLISMPDTLSIKDFAFVPGTSLLASGSFDLLILLWDTALLKPLARPLLPAEDMAPAIAYSPDGSTLFAVTEEGPIRSIDLTGRRQPASFLIPDAGSILWIAAADGKLLWSDDRHRFGLWDLVTEKNDLVEQADAAITALAIHDPEVFAIGTAAGQVTLWHHDKNWTPVMLRKQPRSQEPLGYIEALAFDPGGRALVAGDRVGHILDWDIASQAPHQLPPLPDGVTDLAFSRDGRQIAVSTRTADATIYLIRPYRGQPVPVGTRCGEPVEHVAFSRDGRSMWAECGGDLQLLRPEGETWASAETIELADDSVEALAPSPTDNAIATVVLTSLGETPVELWDLDLTSWQRKACRMANREMPATILGWTGLPAGRCKSLLLSGR